MFLVLQFILVVLGDKPSSSPDLRRHLENLSVPITELKEVRQKMTEDETALDRDPGIEKSQDLRRHLKNLAVSNTKLKDVQLRMMEGEITLDRDPMIEGYEERISGHSFDPENDENMLKAIKNINTPMIIRMPAAPAFYLGAVHH